MRYPTDNNRITSDFGWRTLGSKKTLDYHSGVDYGGVVAGIGGDYIYPIADNSKVVRVGNDTDGYGRYVVLEHTTHCSLYCHLETVLVREGDAVNEDTPLGLMGTTGNSTGVHLHFEIHECLYKNFWDRYSNNEPIYAVDPEFFFYKYIESEKKNDIDDYDWKILYKRNQELKTRLSKIHEISG